MKFSHLITDIVETGMTQIDISIYSGCSDTLVSLLKTGARHEPTYSIGKRMVRLHGERTALSVKVGRVKNVAGWQ